MPLTMTTLVGAIGRAQVNEQMLPKRKARREFAATFANTQANVRFCKIFQLAHETEDPLLRNHIWRVVAVMLGNRHDLAKRTSWEIREPDSPDAENRQNTRDFQVRWMIGRFGTAYGLTRDEITLINECHQTYGMWAQYDQTGESYKPDVKAAEEDAAKILGTVSVEELRRSAAVR